MTTPAPATARTTTDTALHDATTRPVFVEGSAGAALELISSGNYTPTQTGSPTYINMTGVSKYVRLFFLVTIHSISGGSLTVYINTLDALGNSYGIYGSTAQSAAGTLVVSVGPGLNIQDMFTDSINVQLQPNAALTGVSIDVCVYGQIGA